MCNKVFLGVGCCKCCSFNFNYASIRKYQYNWMCHISYNLPYMLKVTDLLQLIQKTEIVYDDTLIFKSILKTFKLVGFVFFVYRAYIYSCMLLCEYEILCFFFLSFFPHMKFILTKQAPGNPWLYLLTEELGPVYLHV